MGFLSRLLGRGGDHRPAKGPSRAEALKFKAQSGTTEFPQPIDAIRAACALAARVEGTWATIEARDPVAGQTRVIQFAGEGPYSVNLCLEVCDVPAVARDAGLSVEITAVDEATPIEGVVLGGLWEVETPEAAAEVIDAVFRLHYRLGDVYEASATIEG